MMNRFIDNTHSNNFLLEKMAPYIQNKTFQPLDSIVKNVYQAWYEHGDRGRFRGRGVSALYLFLLYTKADITKIEILHDETLRWGMKQNKKWNDFEGISSLGLVAAIGDISLMELTLKTGR